MKNIILKLITKISMFAFMIGICCLDTEGYWPFVVCLVSGSWIILFTYANCFYFPEDKENENHQTISSVHHAAK